MLAAQISSFYTLLSLVDSRRIHSTSDLGFCSGIWDEKEDSRRLVSRKGPHDVSVCKDKSNVSNAITSVKCKCHQSAIMGTKKDRARGKDYATKEHSRRSSKSDNSRVDVLPQTDPRMSNSPYGE
ncbi:hypothetical protein BKA93DRAFT_45301 [Sparassis latifolia]